MKPLKLGNEAICVSLPPEIGWSCARKVFVKAQLCLQNVSPISRLTEGIYKDFLVCSPTQLLSVHTFVLSLFWEFLSERL